MNSLPSPSSSILLNLAVVLGLALGAILSPLAAVAEPCPNTTCMIDK